MDPRNAIATHFWGKRIKPDATWLADEAIRALTDAGFKVTPGAKRCGCGPRDICIGCAPSYLP